MLLARLKEYADERLEDQLPPLYAMTPVASIVVIDQEGRAVSPEPVSRIDPSTTRGKRGLDMAAPEVQRSSGITPLLLADNGEYTFGRARAASKQGRVDRAHGAYLELLRRCAIETEEPAVLAVLRFFEHGGAQQLSLGEDWDSGLKVTFEVLFENGERQRPINLPAVQEFWLAISAPGAGDREQCLVCGDSKPVLDRLQAKVKGIRGGQSAGTSIISANSEAFESYGLRASRTAPTCRECGEAFTRALNHLLADEANSLAVAGATFVFWTRGASEFDLGSFMRAPAPEQVRALIESAGRGRRAAPFNEADFYAASLSASGGRAVVRDWIDTTVGAVEANMKRWFELQRISDPRDEDPLGEHPRPLSLFQLAVSTVRAAADLPVTTTRALFRAALEGGELPLEIAFQAVRRNRAEQGIRRERAALIKLVHLSRKPQLPKEDYMVALEAEHEEPAYHCGRLLAVLESVQRAALGPSVNATIVDRYYGAASATPAVVFGSLLRGAQPHLAKLEGARRGGLQNRIMEVCERIDGFPRTLSLEQQALFSLGYYHQRAHDRAEANRRRAERDGANDETEKE